MKCLFCEGELAPLRIVTSGLFCSNQHRTSYERAHGSFRSIPDPSTSLIPLDWWVFEPVPEAWPSLADPSQSAPFFPKPARLLGSALELEARQLASADQLIGLHPQLVLAVPAQIQLQQDRALPVAFSPEPRIPLWASPPLENAIAAFGGAHEAPEEAAEEESAPEEATLEPVAPEAEEHTAPPVAESPTPQLCDQLLGLPMITASEAGVKMNEFLAAPVDLAATPVRPRWESAPIGYVVEDIEWHDEVVRSLQKPSRRGAVPGWLADAWKRSPSDLKLATSVLFILVALSVARSFNMPLAPQSGGVIRRVVVEQLGSFRQQLASRAAIDFTDDFRTGLDDWQGRENTPVQWSYDATGFVRPGALALFRPTVALTDYRFEFLGEIDDKAMGCAFRAVDPENYYAVKFVVVTPGPLPVVRLVRYAVVNGKEERHQERPLPFPSQKDTLYRVLIDVRGEDFTIMSQGQVVDFWTDSRLKKGGVGLFCGRGERARVRWVEVSHQYDTLGKLCAYLAPYSGVGRSGSLN